MSITRLNPAYQPVGNYQPAGSYLEYITVSLPSSTSMSTAAGMSAIANALPNHDCSFRISAGWQAMGMYLYANEKYQALFIFDYGGIYYGKKNEGTWTSTKVH